MISDHTNSEKNDMLIYDENISDYKNRQIRPSLVKMISGHAVLDKNDLWSQYRRR